MDNVQSSRRVLFILVGAGIVLMAVVVLIGWIFHLPGLTAVFPGYPTMKFNTALAFLFAGLATMLVDSAGKKNTKCTWPLRLQFI
jgi:hypothetical protein